MVPAHFASTTSSRAMIVSEGPALSTETHLSFANYYVSKGKDGMKWCQDQLSGSATPTIFHLELRQYCLFSSLNELRNADGRGSV